MTIYLPVTDGYQIHLVEMLETLSSVACGVMIGLDWYTPSFQQLQQGPICPICVTTAREVTG